MERGWWCLCIQFSILYTTYIFVRVAAIDFFFRYRRINVVDGELRNSRNHDECKCMEDTGRHERERFDTISEGRRDSKGRVLDEKNPEKKS